MLADLLKQAANATSEKEAPAATTAPADAQTQELQALLISVLKSVAQMLPQLLAALDQSGGDALNDFLGGAGAGPQKKVREVGLHSSGLKTSGLNLDGSPSATSDEDWNASSNATIPSPSHRDVRRPSPKKPRRTTSVTPVLIRGSAPAAL